MGNKITRINKKYIGLNGQYLGLQVMLAVIPNNGSKQIRCFSPNQTDSTVRFVFTYFFHCSINIRIQNVYMYSYQSFLFLNPMDLH